MIGAKDCASLRTLLKDSRARKDIAFSSSNLDRVESIDERRDERMDEVDDELSLRSRLRFGLQLDFWPEDRGMFDERWLEKSLLHFIDATDCRGDNEASS